MKTVGLFDAKTRLSELCREVAENGEEFVITKRGQAIARIVPTAPVQATNPYLAVGILEALAAWNSEWPNSDSTDSDFPDIWLERSGSKPSPFAQNAADPA